MMGQFGYGPGWMMGGQFSVFGVINWILVVALLIAVIRWVWKKGDKI